MKNTLALVLAAIMTAGMTTVAFANATNNNNLKVTLVGTAGNTLYVDDNDDNHFNTDDDTFDDKKGTNNKGAIAINAPANDKELASVDLAVVKGGKKVAIPLLKDATKDSFVTEKDDVKRLKVKTEWKVGKLDEKPEIEFVKIGTEYVYAVTFTLPESAEIKTSDLAGSISVYETSSQLKDDYNDKELVTLNFGSEYGYKEVAYAGQDLAKAEVVDFDGYSDDVETLTFGDDFEFEVDLAGQGKLNLKNNREFLDEFAAKYDYANIDFINFVKTPSFNKNGTAYIFAEKDEFVYEVTEDGAKAIAGLEWDEDYDAWTFKTRTLKSYAISDVELDKQTETEDKNESSKPESGKDNPDTGR